MARELEGYIDKTIPTSAMESIALSRVIREALVAPERATKPATAVEDRIVPQPRRLGRGPEAQEKTLRRDSGGAARPRAEGDAWDVVL